jgi:acetyl esterase
VPGPADDIAVRRYRPLGSAPVDQLPLLVWFHGGGWTIGSVEGSDGTCRSLANRSGAAVVSVEYRLAPEHTFPAAVDDCWAATTWIAEHGAEWGLDPSRLAVGGDSAGGNLATIVASMARDAGGPPIALQVLVYPATDLRMNQPSIKENGQDYLLTEDDMHWFLDHYGVGRVVDATDWRISPALADTLERLPPAYVVTAEYDPLRDDGQDYVEALRRAGVDAALAHYDGMIHGFFGMLGQIDDAETAHDDVAAALRRAFGGE